MLKKWSNNDYNYKAVTDNQVLIQTILLTQEKQNNIHYFKYKHPRKDEKILISTPNLNLSKHADAHE